jgi:hypothetical protein
MLKVPLRKKRNFKNLTLENSPVVVSSPPASAPNTANDLSTLSNTSITKGTDYAQLCEQLGELEIGLELRLDLRPEDFKNIDELGRGNGGTVSKVLHVRTSTVMAKKVITII